MGKIKEEERGAMINLGFLNLSPPAVASIRHQPDIHYCNRDRNTRYIIMARYFGFRGRKLNVASIFLIVMPAIMTFGYSQAVAGGVLDFPSFQAQFPEMDTINTTGDQKRYNSTIQGQ